MVTDKKFTQGEWKVVKDETYPTLHQIWNNVDFGEMPTYIARTCYAPLSEANAKLIATAPELLEALNYAIRFIRLCPLINEDQYPKGLENWELLIKKATE